MFRFVSAAIAGVVFLLSSVSVARAQSLEEQVLERVNIERWSNGQLPPLKGEALLDSTSEAHSLAMADRNFFAHCDLDTKLSPFQRMSAAGYAWNSAAENIAAGRSTAALVMQDWMGSAGHRANILGTNYREIGIGVVFQSGDLNNVRLDTNGDCNADASGSGYGHYWTQNFGRRGNVSPLVIAREAYQTGTCEVALYAYGAGAGNQMRLSNDGSSWTAWGPLLADSSWTLAGASGSLATVHAELRIGGSTYGARDTIRLATACGAGGAEPPLFSNEFE